MTLKFSAMCAVRTDLAGRVEAALDNYLGEIALGYGGYLASALEEGEAELDVRHQLVLLSRKVKHHRQRIDSLDGGVLEQTHGDDKVRAEIDQRTAAVDAKLRLVRSAYRGFYGLNNLDRVGLKGIFPRGAVALHRQAVVIKTSLESPDLVLDLGLADQEGESTNVASRLAAQLDPELSRLGELLDERHHENSRTLDLRLQRQQVIRDFDYNIRGIVRMAQGMFRLAGRNDLGTRTRPILRRALRKLEDQEAKENAEAEVDAATEGAEAGAIEPAAGTVPAATTDPAPPTDPATTDDSSA